MSDKFPIVDARDDHADNQTTYVPISALREAGLLPEESGASQAKALNSSDASQAMGGGRSFLSHDAARYSGIEGRIDLLNERRVRSAHGDKRKAVRDRETAKRVIERTRRDAQALNTEGLASTDAQARRHTLERRAVEAEACFARARSREAEADSILKQAYRNPHLFGVLFEHNRFHNPDEAIADLVKFGKQAGPALQIAAVRLLAAEYERLNKEQIARGGTPRAAFASFLAAQWGTDPVTIRRLQSKASRLVPGTELAFAGTIFDTQRDMEKLAKKEALEQASFAEHARAHRTLFVLAGRLVEEARKRRRKTLFEAELQALDEIGRNDSVTRAFLYTLPLANSAIWLADQTDAYRNSLEAA